MLSSVSWTNLSRLVPKLIGAAGSEKRGWLFACSCCSSRPLLMRRRDGSSPPNAPDGFTRPTTRRCTYGHVRYLLHVRTLDSFTAFGSYSIQFEPVPALWHALHWPWLLSVCTLVSSFSPSATHRLYSMQSPNALKA